MKTPKEILLNRHSAATPKLDSIRELVVATECQGRTQKSKIENQKSATSPLVLVLKAWRELILPARKIWVGFAFVWAVIAVLNLAESDPSAGMLATAQPNSPATGMNWREQQKLMAELTGSTEPIDIEKPKTTTPKPRSAWRSPWQIA